MTDDEPERFSEWHHASVSITADPQSTTLVSITLTLIPEDMDEAITYGGFVDLLPAHVEDNVIATGVDSISRTAIYFDPGFQEDFWIMAPLQGPESFTYENLSRFRIDMGGSNLGILSCDNATPDSDMGSAVSNELALNGEPQNVLWQGSGTGVDSEKTVKMKINGSETETALPIKVKAMKYRNVKLRVCLVAKDLGDGASAHPDPVLLPTKPELEAYLNPLFAYQLNSWFEVTIHQDTKLVNFGQDFEVANPHTVDQKLAYDSFQEHGHYDIQVFIVGKNGFLSGDSGAHTVGYASRLERTCWVLGRVQPKHDSKQMILHTIGHEIGHILFGPGHPDEMLSTKRGVAPLVGTDHTKRLMASGKIFNSNSRLIVKREWDEAEKWLKDNPDRREQEQQNGPQPSHRP